MIEHFPLLSETPQVTELFRKNPESILQIFKPQDLERCGVSDHMELCSKFIHELNVDPSFLFVPNKIGRLSDEEMLFVEGLREYDPQVRNVTHGDHIKGKQLFMYTPQGRGVIIYELPYHYEVQWVSDPGKWEQGTVYNDLIAQLTIVDEDDNKAMQLKVSPDFFGNYLDKKAQERDDLVVSTRTTLQLSAPEMGIWDKITEFNNLVDRKIKDILFS